MWKRYKIHYEYVAYSLSFQHSFFHIYIYIICFKFICIYLYLSLSFYFSALFRELAKRCPIPVEEFTYDSPHTKANLLFQAHFSRLSLPCSDYYTDLKSVLDQAIRIIQVHDMYLYIKIFSSTIE